MLLVLAVLTYLGEGADAFEVMQMLAQPVSEVRGKEEA